MLKKNFKNLFILNQNYLKNKIFNSTKIINKNRFYSKDINKSNGLENNNGGLENNNILENNQQKFENKLVESDNINVVNTNINFDVFKDEGVSNAQSFLDQILDVISLMGWCEYFITQIHNFFPWWGSIAIFTLILRIILVPFYLKTLKSSLVLQEIAPQQKKILQKIKEASILDEKRHYQSELYSLYNKHGTSPFKIIAWGILQMPIFITMFLTLKRMASNIESFQWVKH
jgi:membrane protein insertase Oxa1/YidC/SpoIIIJ